LTRMYVYAYGCRMSTRLPCYCASLRRAARIISKKYDEALGSVGLTVTHFTLLTAIRDGPGVRVNDLVDVLGMDQTTLSRTLKLMERDDLIIRQDGDDRRESRWVLTSEGRTQLRRAEPHWKKAQASVENLLGEQGARTLSESVFRLTQKLTT
jgi:DNA-binding MarR family transcriptional regulator